MKNLGGWLGLTLVAIFVVHGVGESTARAGAWNRPQWGFVVQLGTNFTFADDRFDGAKNDKRIAVGRNYGRNKDGTIIARKNENGELVPIIEAAPLRGGDCSQPDSLLYCSNYQQLNTDLYFELGLLRRLTILGDIAFVSARQANEGGEVSYHASGMGDLMLGARVAILEKPVALALESKLFVPLADPNSIVPLGPGDFRGELRLALGKAWSELMVPVYFDLELGVMFRGTGSSREPENNDGTFTYKTPVHYKPEVLVHGELGLTVVRRKRVDRLLLIASLDYRSSTSRTGSDTFTLTPETQEYTAVSGALVGFVWRGLGLSLRYMRIVEGRNVLSATTVSGAIFASF